MGKRLLQSLIGILCIFGLPEIAYFIVDLPLYQFTHTHAGLTGKIDTIGLLTCGWAFGIMFLLGGWAFFYGFYRWIMWIKNGE